MSCTPKGTHIRSNKTQLSCDAELMNFAELIISLLNLIRNVAERNTNVNVSGLSSTDKPQQQIDSFVVKPRNIWEVKL